MSLKLATSSDFYTQAFNFVSATQSGVDPRTGLYTLKCAIADLSPNDGLGPQLKLALNYTPLSTSTVGLGTGCTLGLSSYDTDHSLLTLASGEQYKIIESSSNVVVKQKKIDNFRFEKFPDHYKITHKSGQTEILTGPDVAWHTKVPARIFAPGGHAVTLNWTYVGGQPRLLNIQDEQATVLVEADYSAGTGQTTLTVWTGSTESRRIVLHFMNDRLNSLDQVAGDTTLTWQFKNEVVGDYTLITGLTSPSGLIEQVSYQKDGHAFPSSAGMKPLPYVTRLTQYPQRNQPEITRDYRYTTTNYLGGGNGQSWSNSEDYLYGVLSSYLYGSTETRQDGDVLIETTRTYNNYHLLTEEKITQDGCVRTKTTDYYAVVGKVFDDQPNQFQFPNKVTVQYTSASGDTSEPEVTHTEFDDSGNTTKKVEPDGMTTIWDYYPAAGDGDNCPPEPNGFMRCLKLETVTPAPSNFSTPTHTTGYTYIALPGSTTTAGSPIETVVVGHTETYQSDSQTLLEKTTEYVNEPSSIDHGRVKQQTTVLYAAEAASYTNQKAFAFNRMNSSTWTQTTTLTGYDGATMSTSQTLSRFTGQKLSAIDELGNETRYRYDGFDRLLSKTLNPGSDYENTTTYAYTVAAPGSTTTVTDAKGNATRSTHDGLERIVLKERLDNDNAARKGTWYTTETHQYDALGRKSQSTVTDTLDQAVAVNGTASASATLKYDSWGRNALTVFNDGHDDVSDYNPITRTATSSVKNDKRTLGKQVITYSISGVPTSIIRYTSDGKEDSTESREYDGLRRLRKLTDAMGNVTTYDYDPFDRVSLTTLPDHSTVSKTYAPHSTRKLVVGLVVTDADGTVFDMGTQTFDGLERRTQTISGGRIYAFTYEKASTKPSTITTPDQQEIAYQYVPELGNALKQVSAADLLQTFDYDKLTGAMSHAQEQGSRENTWNYYPSNRLKEEIFKVDGSNEKSATYTYSLLGQQQTYVDVTSVKQTHEYDEFGRRKSVSDADISASLAYDDLGRFSSQTVTDLASNATLVTTLTYDDFSREIQRDITQDNAPTLTITQEYQENGQLSRRTTRQANTDLRDEQYHYDERNRLVTYTCSGSTLPLDAYGKPVQQQSFTYDVLSNITQLVTTFDGDSDTTTFIYGNTADPTQLTRVTHTHEDYPPAIELSYDACGRLTLDEAGRTLGYDVLGRLRSVSGGDANGGAYAYDALNTLTQQRVKDGDTHDLYYRAGQLVNEIAQENAQRIRWLKLGANCLGQRIDGPDASTQLTGTDAMNSVLLAASGKEQQAFAYSPYGSRTAPDNSQVRLGFNGERLDPVSGTYHLGNGYRAYNPVLMRFNTPDSWSPFGDGGVNPYAYCAGDPINQADPSGHMHVGGILGIIFGVFSLVAAVFTAGASLAAYTAATVVGAAVSATVGATASVSAGVIGGVIGGVSGSISAGLGIASGVVKNRKVASALGWASLGIGLAAGAMELVPQLARSVRSFGNFVGEWQYRLQNAGGCCSKAAQQMAAETEMQVVQGAGQAAEEGAGGTQAPAIAEDLSPQRMLSAEERNTAPLALRYAEEQLYEAGQRAGRASPEQIAEHLSNPPVEAEQEFSRNCTAGVQSDHSKAVIRAWPTLRDQIIRNGYDLNNEGVRSRLFGYVQAVVSSEYTSVMGSRLFGNYNTSGAYGGY
ncbi:RHS repeat protein [Enterobacter cloacae]|uniref:RHS repeat-associated core domain-containing protein n=1 Tax=Enterobacter cloacae TaxID=550 RepID=UPI0034A4B655